MFEIEGVTKTIWVIIGCVNIPVYFFIGKLFFGDMAGFFESLRYWFTPNIISMFRGKWTQDVGHTWKLIIWLVVCFACVYSEAKLVGKILL